MSRKKGVNSRSKHQVWVVRKRSMRKCRECWCFCRNGTDYYCATHQRIHSSHFKRGVPRTCLGYIKSDGTYYDCQTELEVTSRSRATRCQRCKKIHRSRMKAEREYRTGHTKMAPKYRRKCHYLDCRRHISAGPGTTGMYCAEHREMVEQESQHLYRAKRKQNAMKVIEYCTGQLQRILMDGVYGREEAATLTRVSNILKQIRIGRT